MCDNNGMNAGKSPVGDSNPGPLPYHATFADAAAALESRSPCVDSETEKQQVALVMPGKRRRVPSQYPEADNGQDGTCFYCRQPLGQRIERDHFPIPFDIGGDRLVLVCERCHELKDRFALNSWSMDALGEAFAGMTTAPARILVAKLLAVALRQEASGLLKLAEPDDTEAAA